MQPSPRPALNQTMIIRDFRDADLDAVLWLNVRALNPDASRQGDATRYRDLLDIAGVYQRDGAFLVGEDGGAIVAMGAIHPFDAVTSLSAPLHSNAGERMVFELKRLRVAANAVRRGYASTIVGELEARVRARGGTTIVLDTTVQQLAAQALYLRLGYAETHRSLLENDAGTFDLVHYRKDVI